MPEYLAPGVYLEEIDTGPKPIEGVSTSTAGFVGMAERGPVNVPILVTSVGDFTRWFGGPLDIDEFRDLADPTRAHCYLPHAIDGFFTNGGKRAYVVRVVPEQASRAGRFAYDRGNGTAATVLLRAAAQGSGSAATYGLYVLDAASIPAAGQTLRVGDGSSAEYRTVGAVTAPSTRHVPLDRVLQWAHPAGAGTLREYARTPVGGLGGPQTLGPAAAAGATAITVVSPADDLTAVALPWLVELSAGGLTELSLVTAVAAAGADYALTLAQPLAQAYPSGQTVTLIQRGATVRNLETPASSGDAIVFADADGGAAGDIVELGAGSPQHEIRIAGALSQLPLAQTAYWPLPAGTVVDQVTLADDGAVAAKALTATVFQAGRTLQLDNRTDLDVGDVVRIGAAPNEEYGTIVSIPGERGPAPDAGSVILRQPLMREYPSGTAIVLQLAPAIPAAPHTRTRLIQAADAGAEQILVGFGQGWAAGEFARLTAANGDVSYHRLDGASVAIANTGLVTLTSDLSVSHPAGSPVVQRNQLFAIEALDAGAWGNRLLVSVEDEESGLATFAETTLLTPPLQIAVTSLTGIEAGTLLELTNSDTGGQVLLKVRRIDRSNRTVTFDGPGLDAAAMAALGAIANPLQIRSREFRLTVLLRRRPDPAVPARNDQILDSESFRHLSMDHRHSRYFQTVIGAINGPLRLSDRRPEGESDYVRVEDTLSDAATEAIRLGPEALIDILPGNVVRAARHPLSGGDDSLVSMGDAVYLGMDDPEPLNRTGLTSLRNIPQVSLVAIPGQATPAVQAGLIAHCELMRYRFAVLDPNTSDSALADIQSQRQLFDTKYAAIYYPWLLIPDPLPDNLASVADFPLPPSGHVLGVFARTDEERGVHKAPANEVVRGITGLTRKLSKSEQDILNPSPVNINVIRDFRTDNRGLRIWGARCITSDTDHKYVPVRRLLIFLEQSIETGLQWVVFEPNAEPLWARVRRSISNFLTDVWRDGALEGTKPEEAFFVRCDRTTMTQTDIDNGRLICVIGVAPVKPAEFVIIRIGLWTANSDQ